MDRGFYGLDNDDATNGCRYHLHAVVLTTATRSSHVAWNLLAIYTRCLLWAPLWARIAHGIYCACASRVSEMSFPDFIARGIHAVKDSPGHVEKVKLRKQDLRDKNNG